MTHHPHVHMIVPGGGIALDGSRRLSCKPHFLLPVQVLSRLFRGLSLAKLRAALQAGRLKFFGDHADLDDARAFKAYLAPLRKIEWVVYAKRPFGGPQAVLTYLSRYTHRVGGRFAVAVGGSFTGRGADVIIIDDPLKADDAQSEKARRAVNDWYGTTLLSRLDDKNSGAIVLVMQRLHEDDLAGKLLRDGGWRHLDLPAIALEDEEIAIGLGAVHRRRAGEALHPERESLAILQEIKRQMGSLAFTAQYLQRPVPPDGNLIKRSWLQWYDEAPAREPGAQVVQSWDIASTTANTADWSVCTTWLVVKRTYYLIDLWRGRLEFPQLRRKMTELANNHKPNRILIEQAGPGLHMIQELRANPVCGVPIPIGIKPEGDKLVRMEAQCARFEAGQVYLPREAPWLDVFLHEALAFPNARHDDQVDSVSQFLNWAEAEHRWRPTVSFHPPIIIYG
jgi:predicted phage terminase large subunit-like protein